MFFRSFYGLEIIIPTGSALAVLESQYKKLLIQILTIPSTTADPTVFILSGTLSVVSLIHKLMLKSR